MCLNTHLHNHQNQDTYPLDHISDFNSQTQKDSVYNKEDLKNFEKLDSSFHGYEANNANFNDKFKSIKVSQNIYKKNDLENFNQIIKNEENYKKNSEKIVNVYEYKNSKSKKES